MNAHNPPADFEERRLEALKGFEVLDTPPEETFDRITRLAKALMEAPIALVSLVDRDRQWFKSRQGLDMAQSPRNVSFCAHAIEHDGPLIVPDARKDPRFRDNPLVVGDPKIRFYLGIPLKTSEGYNLGTLCVMDRRPRQASQTQIAAMYDLASFVIDELELRRLATTDTLTGALTQRTFMKDAGRAFDVAGRYGRPFSCIVLDVDQFGSIRNDKGPAAGDAVLRAMASACRATIRPVDLFGRTRAEEFAIAMPETNLEGAEVAAERLRHHVAIVGSEARDGVLGITASLGVASQGPHDRDVVSLLNRAGTAMFRAKQAGRNRVMVSRGGFE